LPITWTFDPTDIEQLDHALGLQRDVIAAAFLEAGFAMAGDVGDDHPVAADKVPGKTQPEILSALKPCSIKTLLDAS
jgi:hypothetical protein